MLTGKYVVSGCFAAILGVLAGPALAQNSQGGGGGAGCSSLPPWSQVKSQLMSAVTGGGNGGLGNNMWATIVDTSGIVCAVAFSGNDYTSQWLGSRVISAQKANSGNAFSLGAGATGTVIALSSANLYSAVQPGGSLYGLQASNPVETDVAYGNSSGGQGNYPANAQSFGTPNDPLVGQRVGGINVFGGGLALYSRGGIKVGGLGVSGDTSCTDHMVAWRTRSALGLDQFGSTIGGVAALFASDPSHPDNMIFDITPNPNGGTGNSANGFGHPTCLNNPPTTNPPGMANSTSAGNLPKVR
jgi:Haem-degrading